MSPQGDFGSWPAKTEDAPHVGGAVDKEQDSRLSAHPCTGGNVIVGGENRELSESGKLTVPRLPAKEHNCILQSAISSRFHNACRGDNEAVQNAPLCAVTLA